MTYEELIDAIETLPVSVSVTEYRVFRSLIFNALELEGQLDAMEKRLAAAEKAALPAANTASCLANGILPD